MVLNAFKSGVFPLQPTEVSGNSGMSDCVTKVSDRFSLKILTPKQMLERLPITLAKLKAGKRSENLTKWNPSNNIFFTLSKRNY